MYYNKVYNTDSPRIQMEQQANTLNVETENLVYCFQTTYSIEIDDRKKRL